MPRILLMLDKDGDCSALWKEQAPATGLLMFTLGKQLIAPVAATLSLRLTEAEARSPGCKAGVPLGLRRG